MLALSHSKKLITTLLYTSFCCVFSHSVFAGTWITPTNNELPLGLASGVAPYVFNSAVDFPFANQAVEVWFNSGDSRLYYAYYDGTNWITPVNNQIPLGNASNINQLLNAVYDPNSEQLVMVWASSSGLLYYAYYDGTTWETPISNSIPLKAAPGVLSFNKPIATDQFIFIWEGVLHGPLYYSIYDGTTWNTPDNNEIPLGDSGPLRFFYNPCYNPVTNQVMEIWQDTALTHIYYSVFDGTNWTNGKAIPLGKSTGVGYGAFTNPLYFSPSNQIVEIWQDGANGRMYYSVFDGNNWVTPENNEIPLGASTSVGEGNFAYPVYDSATQQVVLVWQDGNNNLMYSASYDGKQWSAQNNLIPLGASTEIYSYFNPVYDDYAGQVVINWEQSSTDQFYYATYNGERWSAPANNSIPLGLSTNINVYRDVTYDSSSKQLLLIWQDFTESNRLFYTTYNVFAPSPAASFGGKSIKERFLSQTDLINLLEWNPSTDSSVIKYLLRREGKLIFTGTEDGPFSYADHNRDKNVVYTYTLTTQNYAGLESSPLTVTIKTAKDRH